jgi:hypothetical protein
LCHPHSSSVLTWSSKEDFNGDPKTKKYFPENSYKSVLGLPTNAARPFLEKLFKKDAEQKGYFLPIHFETDFAKRWPNSFLAAP